VQSLPNYCRLKRQNAVLLAAVRNGVIAAKHAFYRFHGVFTLVSCISDIGLGTTRRREYLQWRRHDLETYRKYYPIRQKPPKYPTYRETYGGAPGAPRRAKRARGSAPRHTGRVHVEMRGAPEPSGSGPDPLPLPHAHALLWVYRSQMRKRRCGLFRFSAAYMWQWQWQPMAVSGQRIWWW
jgi:hypothetical protein